MLFSPKEKGQGMVEYLIILAFIIFTIFAVRTKFITG